MALVRGCNFPDDLYYNVDDNVWARRDSDGTIIIGMTAYGCALSGEIVTPAADQYSLATIAYLLLTGALPYTARTPREMFTQLLSQPPLALNKAKPGLMYSAGVEQVVMKGLERPPQSRYADVMSFSGALQDVLLSPDVLGGPESGGFLGKMKGLFRRD